MSGGKASAPLVVACPRCAKPVTWSGAARFRPFCSERCKLTDLGAWATQSYRVPESPEGGDGGDLNDESNDSR
ncbi:MAG: DNA gyrase inhibitor YacG [Burkholderiales bacterium]